MRTDEKVLEYVRKYAETNRFHISPKGWILMESYYVPLNETSDVEESARNALREYCVDFRLDFLKHFNADTTIVSEC